MPDLKPTSYAILGLLAARPWSAYELAQHMKTSSNLRQIWPRAESKIYEAPKALVAAGCATSRAEKAGGRTRTVYRITAKGRKALRDWLDDPGAPPYMEFESMLKVAYANAGTLDQLRSTFLEIRRRQLAAAEAFLVSGSILLDEGFKIPERAHTSALVAGMVAGLGRAMGEWVVWADEVTAKWDEIEIDDDKRAWAETTYREMLTELEAIVAEQRKKLTGS